MPTTSRRAIHALFMLMFCIGLHAGCAAASAETGGDENLKLNYDKPATQWMLEALPIGNGHMGAMIYGGVERERIQFNEESLWVGNEDDTGAYQNFGEVTFRFGDESAVSNPSDNDAIAGQSIAESADGIAGTKWCFEHHGKFPIVWQMALPADHPPIVDWYSITSANDVPERDPRDWKFEGSRDGVTWSVLDEHRDEPIWPARQEARKFTFANKTAYRHYRIEFLAVHSNVPHFQVAEIALGGVVAPDRQPRNYRRELDLNRAVHTVTYELGGVKYKREAFACFPAKVIVVRFTADKPGAISGVVAMSDAHGAKTQADGHGLIVSGAFPAYKYDGGKDWPALNREAQVRVLNVGGRVTASQDKITVEKANSVTLLLDAGTDFLQDSKKNWRGVLPHDAIVAHLDAAEKTPYEKLLADHVADHAKLFSRVHLELGGKADAAVTTEQRLKNYKVESPDLGLEELVFQYGRYLMIASSREGGLPANLQGKWNDSNSPPWRSDYHTDVNVEMNYWMVDQANLSECFEPYAKWIDSIVPVRTAATKKAFNTRGWVMRGESGLFGGSTWDWVPGTSAWLMQNSFDHYRYTGDKEYLRTLAYPAMKGVCEFWIDRLKALPDGTLVAPDGYSPEQGPREDGVSFDQQQVWDVFTSTIEASEILGVDKDFRELLMAKRAKLLGPTIGKWGQLQEWMVDRDDPKNTHRHLSHLIAVHPGRQISPTTTPELAAAAKISLTARGDAGTGWSTAWKINQWARLHNGDHAHKLFGNLFHLVSNTSIDMGQGGGLYANLLDAHPPFQIDGNFGYTAGVCEMLVQSHIGEIELLPALPKAWASGVVIGLRARTGVFVDLQWKDGKVVMYRISSDEPREVKVRVNGKLKTVKSEKR